MPVSKDEQRIYDIQNKGRNGANMARLATTQANRITDIPKCRRRYFASLNILGRLNPVTTAFANRLEDLTGVVTVGVATTPTPPTTDINVDIDLTNKQRSKEDKQKNVDKLKEKISTGKAVHSVNEYIAFFRK